MMLPCNLGRPLPENGAITHIYTISSLILLTCLSQLGWLAAREVMLEVQTVTTSLHDQVKTMGDSVLTNNIPVCTLPIVHHNLMG